MSSLKGFRFLIDRSGAPVFLDPDEIITLSQAEGYFVAPDKAQADINIVTPGLATQLSLIGIGDDLWLTNFLTGEWDALPADFGFNPALLFDSEIGIQSILASDLTELELVGTERIEGGADLDLYHVAGVMDSARINDLSSGLIGPGQLGIQLWIAPESFELYRAIIRDPRNGGEEEVSVWQVDFSEFDEVVEISPPQTN